MKVDIKLDISEILETYEITDSGVSIVVNKGKISKLSEFNVAEDDEEFPEGKELTRLHKQKERNPKVVQKKKNQVLHSNGKLACEVCGFDFAKFYGKLGYGFAECHHTIPVSKLFDGQKTKLSDLTIVCANCHRMLHRAKPLISTIELRAIIKKVSVK
jgi:5-methylcytosine-specific restriction protein A